MKRSHHLFIAICSILIAALAAPLDVVQTGAVQAELQVQEAIPVQRAIDIAHTYGLSQNRPDQFAVKQTTLAEWFSIIDFEPGVDAAELGLAPNRPIWIVAMKGTVDWAGPGRKGGPGDRFDNISVALSIDGLEQLGIYSAGPDNPIPLGLQR